MSIIPVKLLTCQFSKAWNCHSVFSQYGKHEIGPQSHCKKYAPTGLNMCLNKRSLALHLVKQILKPSGINALTVELIFLISLNKREKIRPDKTDFLQWTGEKFKPDQITATHRPLTLHKLFPKARSSTRSFWKIWWIPAGCCRWGCGRPQPHRPIHHNARTENKKPNRVKKE